MLAGFRAELRHVLVVEDDPALLGWPHPGEGFGKLGLAVAVDAGDAKDLPCPHLGHCRVRRCHDVEQ